MADTRLTGSEILSIIEIGARFNIQRLKFGDLDVCFGAYQPEIFMEEAPGPGAPLPNPGTQLDPQEEFRIKQARIDQLIIEDPVAAEQLMQDADFVDVDDEDPDDKEA